MLTGIFINCFVIHVMTLYSTSGSEDTEIGDDNNYCTKDEVLNIRLTVSNLRDKVLDQKNGILNLKHDIVGQKYEIYEIKKQISTSGKNVEETISELKDLLATQSNRQAEEIENIRLAFTTLIQQQNDTLYRQAEEIENLRFELTSLKQQHNNTLDRQAEEIENLRLDFTALKQQTNTLYSQAEEINDLRRDVTALANQSLIRCPSGFIRFEKTCYRFHDEVKLNWSESIIYCVEHGSSLVMLETMFEYAFLMTYIKQSKITDRYWTAATDADNEGVWTWGRNGTSAEILPWASDGQPNNWAEIQHCVELNYRSALNDEVCSAKRFPLCERRFK